MCDDALLCHSFVYQKSGQCFLRTYFEGFGLDHPFDRTVLCVKSSGSARMGDMLSAESDIPSLCASPALVELARNTCCPQRDAWGCGFLKASLEGLPHIHTLWATAHKANGSRLERVQVTPTAGPGAELFELGMLVTDTWNGVGGDGWLPVPGPARPPHLERPANVVALGPRAAGTAARYYRLLLRRGVVAPGTVVRYEQPWRDDACASAAALHRRVTQEFNVRWRRVDASESSRCWGRHPAASRPPVRASRTARWCCVAPSWAPRSGARGGPPRGPPQPSGAAFRYGCSMRSPRGRSPGRTSSSWWPSTRRTSRGRTRTRRCAQRMTRGRRAPRAPSTAGLPQLRPGAAHVPRPHHPPLPRAGGAHRVHARRGPVLRLLAEEYLFLGQRPLGLFPFPEVLGGQLLTQVSLHDYLEVCWGCGTLIEIDVHI